MRHVDASWETALLVCRKCSKRQQGGFGANGRTALAKVLKRALGKGRKARVGVVEVKCLGICPRHAVTVIDARRPDRWMLVKPGENIDRLLESVRRPTHPSFIPVVIPAEASESPLGEAA